jgi:hypothetical protein
MAWSFNPFTGNLDITGSSGAVVFEGEVATFADLPVTVGDPAVGAAFLVRESTGVWLVNRHVAGIYIRRNNAGLATDWEYAGDYPVNSVNGQSGNVVLGASSVGADPANFQIRAANYTAAVGDKVAADTTSAAWTLTLPATPSNGDTITVLDYAGTFDTNNLTIARNGSNIESLAENMICEVEDAAFTLVFVGSTVGWKVVPYFGNKTNFASPDPIGSSVPNTGRFTTLTANNGTLTASAPVLDLAQTWNASGTTFTGLRFNVTNTASATASNLLDIQVGGTTRMMLKRDGVLHLGQFTNSGFYSPAPTWHGSTAGLLAATNLAIGSTLDTILERGGAGIIEQRNAANAQTFRIYGTYTDASNYERGFVRWSAAGGNFEIGTEGAGTGSGRHMTLRAGANTFSFFNNGEFSSPTSIRITSRMVINSSASGVVAIRNDAGNDFNRLQFGGTDANFPALKRSSTALQVRLADDSAYSVMDAQHRLQGTAPASATATGTAGDIRYDADYIYVCTAANTWKRAAIATW